MTEKTTKIKKSENHPINSRSESKQSNEELYEPDHIKDEIHKIEKTLSPV